MTLSKCLAGIALGLTLLAAAGCGGGSSSRSAPSGAVGTIQGYVFASTRSRGAGQIVLSRQATPPSGTVGLNGATVTLSPGGRTTTTANDSSGNPGFFQIASLAAGTYTATVTHDGYTPGSFTANVLADSTTEVGADNGQTVLAPTTMARKKWTFMVYMDGDNDLEEFGILNMNQMEMVGSDSNVNIVVQFDRSPGFDATNGDWNDCRRFYVQKDSNTSTISSPVVQDLGEVDSGNPQTLRDFITWATTTYPADHYCLVAWNHGAGWRSRNLPKSAASRGILFDDSGNPTQFAGSTFMTMGQFNQGLTVPGVHFDLIAIDCSLMGMLEVAYEIRDQADYLCASEESPPGPGYPYDKILADLTANPDMTSEALGRAIVAEHIAKYSRDAVTQSLIQTSKLPALASKTNDLATALLATLPGSASQLDLARSRTQTYAFTYYRDLYDFANNVQSTVTDPVVSAAATAVMAAVPGPDGPVVAEGHTLASMQNSHGLSIYLPAQSQFYSGYGDLRFCTDYPKWNALVHDITGQ